MSNQETQNTSQTPMEPTDLNELARSARRTNARQARRTCIDCKVTRPINDFYRSGTVGYNRRCKECYARDKRARYAQEQAIGHRRTWLEKESNSEAVTEFIADLNNLGIDRAAALHNKHRATIYGWIRRSLLVIDDDTQDYRLNVE